MRTSFHQRRRSACELEKCVLRDPSKFVQVSKGHASSGFTITYVAHRLRWTVHALVDNHTGERTSLTYTVCTPTARPFSMITLSTLVLQAKYKFE